ncbi:flagellar export protein FliJ [Azospirillum agricola]|uniref:flagellar export protein FliJ n=1 Tax=Azospirillum agricola TaxID=1720247 RepID=UPI000A0F1B65|nr:flagellar export protein FliJ [Azospirillum agricola]MBP2228471.1 flagellar biosynthesis chaperone FliJ [Azospirillum agricola]SMH34404.1 FliJ protein [Azospirillum lipoferum]
MSLKTIIRLQKLQLDEKRRVLAELQNLGDRLKAEIERLKEEIAREQATAREDFAVSFTYANFAQAALERGRRLGESLAQVEVQISVATDQMAEAYQELKRYELAEEERLKREKEKQKRKDANMLDETALIGFRRRQAEEEAAGG